MKYLIVVLLCFGFAAGKQVLFPEDESWLYIYGFLAGTVVALYLRIADALSRS